MLDRPDRSTEIEIRGQHLLLLAERAMFWSEERKLIISDVHLGKTGHFRRSGIALPRDINQNNLDRLDDLIQRLKPASILFLGDLFHSSANSEWDDFDEWKVQYNDLPMYLTAGNHELYPIQEYYNRGLFTSESITSPPFLFTHHPLKSDIDEDMIVVSGHIHPSVKLKGKGRQRLRLPCFRVRDQEVLLPAFGSFTGTHTIEPNADDQIFVIADDKIIALTS